MKHPEAIVVLALVAGALLIFAWGIWDELRRTRAEREAQLDPIVVPLGHKRLGGGS